MFVMPVLLVACLKDKAFMDVSNTQPIIEFANGTSGATDLGNFGMNASEPKLDTAIALNIASPQALNFPVTVTLKIDPAMITKYNAVAGHTQLTLLPDSAYQFTTTTVTIQPGYRIARVPITLFPAKIDPSQSYGLPIAIVSATGPNGQNLIVSGNKSVAFYAFIGNPIAGPYTEEWIRWASYDTTTAPSYDFTNNPNLFIAQTPTRVFVESALNAADFQISFTNNGGTLSNFQITLDPASWANFGAASITTPPTIIRADPVNGVYRFYYQYTLSSGAARTVVQEFVKK